MPKVEIVRPKGLSGRRLPTKRGKEKAPKYIPEEDLPRNKPEVKKSVGPQPLRVMLPTTVSRKTEPKQEQKETPRSASPSRVPSPMPAPKPAPRPAPRPAPISAPISEAKPATIPQKVSTQRDIFSNEDLNRILDVLQNRSHKGGSTLTDNEMRNFVADFVQSPLAEDTMVMRRIIEADGRGNKESTRFLRELHNAATINSAAKKTLDKTLGRVENSVQPQIRDKAAERRDEIAEKATATKTAARKYDRTGKLIEEAQAAAPKKPTSGLAALEKPISRSTEQKAPQPLEKPIAEPKRTSIAERASIFGEVLPKRSEPKKVEKPEEKVGLAALKKPEAKPTEKTKPVEKPESRIVTYDVKPYMRGAHAPGTGLNSEEQSRKRSQEAAMKMTQDQRAVEVAKWLNGMAYMPTHQRRQDGPGAWLVPKESNATVDEKIQTAEKAAKRLNLSPGEVSFINDLKKRHQEFVERETKGAPTQVVSRIGKGKEIKPQPNLERIARGEPQDKIKDYKVKPYKKEEYNEAELFKPGTKTPRVVTPKQAEPIAQPKPIETRQKPVEAPQPAKPIERPITQPIPQATPSQIAPSIPQTSPPIESEEVRRQREKEEMYAQRKADLMARQAMVSQQAPVSQQASAQQSPLAAQVAHAQEPNYFDDIERPQVSNIQNIQGDPAEIIRRRNISLGRPTWEGLTLPGFEQNAPGAGTSEFVGEEQNAPGAGTSEKVLTKAERKEIDRRVKILQKELKRATKKGIPKGQEKNVADLQAALAEAKSQQGPKKRSAWSKIGGFVKKALPWIGTAAGAVVAGPIGAAAGGLAGQGLAGIGGKKGTTTGAGDSGLAGQAAQALTDAVTGGTPGGVKDFLMGKPEEHGKVNLYDEAQNRLINQLGAQGYNEIQPEDSEVTNSKNYLDHIVELLTNVYNPQAMEQNLAPYHQMLARQIGQNQAQQFNFDPFRQKAQQTFQEETLPGIFERFNTLGKGAQSSGAFQGIASRGASDLASNLSMQEQQYGQQQQQLGQGLQQLLQGLLGQQQGYGLQKSQMGLNTGQAINQVVQGQQGYGLQKRGLGLDILNQGLRQKTEPYYHPPQKGALQGLAENVPKIAAAFAPLFL